MGDNYRRAVEIILGYRRNHAVGERNDLGAHRRGDIDSAVHTVILHRVGINERIHAVILNNLALDGEVIHRTGRRWLRNVGRDAALLVVYGMIGRFFLLGLLKRNRYFGNRKVDLGHRYLRKARIIIIRDTENTDRRGNDNGYCQSEIYKRRKSCRSFCKRLAIGLVLKQVLVFLVVVHWFSP